MKHVSFYVIAMLLIIVAEVFPQEYGYTEGWVYGYSGNHNIEVQIVSFSNNSKRCRFEVKKHDNTAFGQAVNIQIRKNSDNGNIVIPFTISQGSFSDRSEYYYFENDFSSTIAEVNYYATMTVGGFTHKAGPVKIHIVRLDSPELQSPNNGASNLSTPIDFNWGNANFASTFRIQIGTSLSGWTAENGFAPQYLVHEEAVQNSNSSWNGGQSGVQYYWSVRAGSNYHYHSVYPDPWAFTMTTARLNPPELQSPANGATNLNQTISFDWSNVANAETYRIQIGTSLSGWTEEDGFATQYMVKNEAVGNSNYEWSEGLVGVEYFWSIRAGSTTIYHSVYPNPHNFTIRLQQPVLLTPVQGATNLTNPISFDWSDVSNASTYRIQIGTSLSGWTAEDGFSQSTMVHEEQVLGSGTQWSTAQPGVQYYWSARAGSNTIYHSLYSDPLGFFTDPGTGIDEYADLTPTQYILFPSFPNPFNPSTRIRYAVPVESIVEISIMSIDGKTVKVLVEEIKESGYHEVYFEAKNLASGVYLCSMKAIPMAGGNAFIRTEKIMILK